MAETEPSHAAAWSRVKKIAAGFEQRRMQLLENTAGPNRTAEQVADPDTDLYSNRALANLLLGRHAEAANGRLRRTAEWFDHPHPMGRDHRGENDFAAMKLCRAWYLFQKSYLLEAATRERIRRFFLTTDFESMHGSENHHFLFRTSRYLMAAQFPGEVFNAWGRTGRDLEREDRAWLDHFIRFRARRGWGEFDSPCYINPDLECLTCLYDFAPDPALRDLAGMMLDLLLVDMAVDSLTGMYCGAHGRIYAPHALDHSTENTWPLQYLYFDAVSADRVVDNEALIDPLTSGYRPRDIIIDIAQNRLSAYENRERKHLHNVKDVMPEKPLDGSIRKYTWWTPQFVMGCVQRQDAYPADAGAWYAHHEQHQWDLSFPAGPQARLFTHHPGKSGHEHGYWTGDLRCGCGHFFQQRGALLALYDIPEEQPYDFIHAYLPAAQFDEVAEDAGWVFVRSGEACAALTMLGGVRRAESMEGVEANDWKRNEKRGQWAARQEWTACELISPGRRNGAVCEVGLLRDYGGFDAFRAEITANRRAFDRDTMRLTYASKRYGELHLDTRGARRLNGRDVNLDYRTYDCPYLQSEWDSGVVEVISSDGTQREVLDFRE